MPSMLADKPIDQGRSMKVYVPAARGRALSRALGWLSVACVLGLIVWGVVPRLRFTPTGVSNRLADYGLAFLMIPTALSALGAAWKGLRRLLLAGWPWPVGVLADDKSLTLSFGPFGTRRFEADRLDVRYYYEMDADFDPSECCEAFLPEDRQKATLLPVISPRDASREAKVDPRGEDSIREMILRFCAGDELHLARTLRPLLAHWRREPQDDETES